MRTKRTDLDKMAELISAALDDRHEIAYAYGRPRLERADGSVDVSPRLAAGEMLTWLHAFYSGILAAGRVR